MKTFFLFEINVSVVNLSTDDELVNHYGHALLVSGRGVRHVRASLVFEGKKSVCYQFDKGRRMEIVSNKR